MERIPGFLRIACLFVAGIVLWTTSAGVGFSQSGSPTIETIYVPAYGSKPAILRGKVSTVDPHSVRTAPLLFLSGLGWFSKPYCTETTVAVASDNTFTVPFWTGGVDETATRFILLLVPADAPVPCVSSAAGVPRSLEDIALAKLVIQRPNPNQRTIIFSGEEFRVKAAAAPVGPGPNRFSDSTESVFVDPGGALHLKLRFIDGNWYSSEVYSARRTVYGRYTFTFVIPTALNPCAVFGAFTWAEAERESREIDAIEVSQFCNAQTQNSQNVVQPFTMPGNLNRFQLPAGVPVTQEMIWEPARIVFRTYIGDEALGAPLNEWVYQGSVPKADSDNLAFRFNLWWFNASGSHSDTEVIVKDFDYVPASATSGLPEIGGVTNAASFSAEALAPCSLFSIFGTGLSSETASASAIPLPRSLAGTKVSVNGESVPLLFVSEGQVNAQVPCNIPTGEASVTVQTANGASAPKAVGIAPEAIGIFRYVDDACIVTDASFDLITNERPAPPGSLVSVFVTGIGRVSPPIPTGEAAPVGAIAPATGTFEAHADDRAATILFLGAAPGFVGVGQGNLQLPALLPSGHRVLRIARSNGGIASTCLIPVGTATLPPLGPRILSATPTSAMPGETVLIRGANFFGGVQVRFGAVFASSVVLLDSSTIRVTVPPGTGIVDLSVRNPDGKQTTLPNAFTYVTPAMSLTSVSPSSGSAGSVTTLRGTGFVDGAFVFFGSSRANSVSVISGTAIQAIVPAGSGTVNVSVQNPDGHQSQLSNAFTYLVPGLPSIQASIVGCQVQGQAQNVSANSARVVIYARTNMYYIQPCSFEPTQALRADRTFGPIDSHVGEIYVLLVAAGYAPPLATTTLPTVDGLNVLDVKGPVGSVSAGCNVARCPAQ